MGSFSQGTISLELTSASIIKECTNYSDNSEDDIYTTTQDDCSSFSVSLRNLNIFKWKKKYHNPGVDDGTHWELSLQEGSQKKNCYGSNNYPPDFYSLIEFIVIKGDISKF